MRQCKTPPKIHHLYTNTPHQGNDGTAREKDKLHYHDRGGAATTHANRPTTQSAARFVQSLRLSWTGGRSGCGEAQIRRWSRWGRRRGRGNRKGQHHDFSTLVEQLLFFVTISVSRIFFASNLVNSRLTFFSINNGRRLV